MISRSERRLICAFTNATVNGISGRTAAEIPALPYLSTSGGSLTGALGIGTSSPSDLFALNGAAYLADIAVPPVTTNRLYSNSGNLYWAGNLLGGATTGNWSSDGTNVWRSGGNVGIGTTSPSLALSVQGNGLFSGALSANAISTTNATSTNLFATNGSFGSLSLTSPLGIGSGGTGTTSSTGAISNFQYLFAGSTSSIARSLASKLSDTVSVRDFGAKGDGVTDDSSAFNAALASGVTVLVPNSSTPYRVCNVVVPSGAVIEGNSPLSYARQTAQTTTVKSTIQATTGCTSQIFNVQTAVSASIRDLFIDGAGQGPDCISAGSTQLSLQGITALRCNNGFGTNGGYTHDAIVDNSEFANNTTGIQGLVDTVVSNTALSANVNGVYLPDGADANNFVGDRFEWNTNYGVTAYEAVTNQFVGGLFDRNYIAAVYLSQSTSFNFSGAAFNRNARNNSGNAIADVYLSGTASTTFTGITSQTGTDDNGTGPLTPQYFLYSNGNSNANIVLSSSDLSGNTVAPIGGTTSANFSQKARPN
jgi:hypothetical protein